MALAERFQNTFGGGQRRLGELLFKSGDVSVLESSSSSFRGTVEGPETVAALQTQFESDGAGLSMSCTCATFASRSCLHLWALILAADESGWEPHLESDDGDDRDLDDESEDDPDDLEAGPSPSVWATRSRGSMPERIQPADWRALLANLNVTTAEEHRTRALREAHAAADRECWLVINSGETLAKRQLHFDCMERRKKLDGEWGALKPAMLSVEDFLPNRGGVQSGVMRTLLTAVPTTRGKAVAGRTPPDSQRRFESLIMDPDMDRAWWQTLAAEVKVGIASVCASGRQVLPATLDTASLWTEEMDVRRAQNGQDWTISLRLRREDGVAVQMDEPLVVFPSGLVIFPDSLTWMRPRTFAEFQWISLLRRSPRVAIPDPQLDMLMAKILELQTTPRINWSEDAVRSGRAWTEETAAPTPVLRLGRGVMALPRSGLIAMSVAFTYAARPVDGDDSREVLVLEGDRHLLRRDMIAERRHVDHLIAQSNGSAVRPSTQSPASLVIPADALLPLVEALEKSGWSIELERARVLSPTSSRAEVSSGIDWFELQADCTFDRQTLRLPALLAALEQKSPFVRLDDGSIGMLPSAWLERFAALAELGQAKDDALRFDKSQIAILDVLLAELPFACVDETFQVLRSKMRRFGGITEASPTDAFKGELRPYQREGLGWLRFLHDFGFGGCLADDMGLGKTIQVLAVLPDSAAAKGPTLVVVPRSLVHNWKAEAIRFRPDLRVLIYDDCDRRSVEKTIPAFDLVIMTYGCLRRDITRLRKVAFEWVILDEAQTIKNRDSQTAKAARVLQGRHRLAMSGTPVENRIEELLSIFEFLNPGMITPGMFRRVRARNVSEHALHDLLGKALRPFILRRTKDQVLPDLPAKTEQTIYCDLDTEQRTRYEELRKHYQAHLLTEVEESGLESSKFHVLEALLRLRQAACHPGLLDDTRLDEPSAKLDALVEQLVDVAESGHKALVFSQFTSLLAIVRARLSREGIVCEYLDGQTRHRERRVHRFQTDASIPVFLISLKAGGVGLNLTAAAYCFILDPWWNPAVEAQAIARAHRIGQTSPVFAYRLIARGTVEERILELQAQKQGVADAIVSPENASLSKMSLDDLRFLLN